MPAAGQADVPSTCMVLGERMLWARGLTWGERPCSCAAWRCRSGRHLKVLANPAHRGIVACNYADGRRLLGLLCVAHFAALKLPYAAQAAGKFNGVSSCRLTVCNITPSRRPVHTIRATWFCAAGKQAHTLYTRATELKYAKMLVYY